MTRYLPKYIRIYYMYRYLRRRIMKLVLNLLKGLIKFYALLHSTEQCTGIKCILPSGRIFQGILKKKKREKFEKKRIVTETPLKSSGRNSVWR